MTTPQIRIPTPVTVHVDQCPQCAKDLAALPNAARENDGIKPAHGRDVSANVFSYAIAIGLEREQGAVISFASMVLW